MSPPSRKTTNRAKAGMEKPLKIVVLARRDRQDFPRIAEAIRLLYVVST